MDVCSSPLLIAAFHVLHRLQVPRHSPHALSSLTIKLVHKQKSLANIRLIISNLINYLQFTLQLVVILHIFSCQISRSKSFRIKNRTLILAVSLRIKILFWWRWQESNLRPPECKSGALPAELHPRSKKLVAGTGFEPVTFGLWAQRATWLLHPAISLMVGLGRLELPTSRLSGVRSNQLSYRPSSCVIKLPLRLLKSHSFTS